MASWQVCIEWRLGRCAMNGVIAGVQWMASWLMGGKMSWQVCIEWRHGRYVMHGYHGRCAMIDVLVGMWWVMSQRVFPVFWYLKLHTHTHTHSHTHTRTHTHTLAHTHTHSHTLTHIISSKERQKDRTICFGIFVARCFALHIDMICLRCALTSKVCASNEIDCAHCFSIHVPCCTSVSPIKPKESLCKGNIMGNIMDNDIMTQWITWWTHNGYHNDIMDDIMDNGQHNGYRSSTS